jgi:hypothetical protein
MSRADTPEDERRDFQLVIDEFHNFTTQSFATILAEARKYRLSLTLCHQYLDQISLPVRQAVLGNVGTLISFRVGFTDAAVLEREFGTQFIAARFADLDRYQMLLRPMSDGQVQEPFLASALPPLENLHQRRAALIRNSRIRYAKGRSEIEDRLRRWSQPGGGEN